MISKSVRKFLVGLNINRVITLLTMSDLLVLSGWGLINPIFAIFIVDKIDGASIQTVGIATTIFFLVKSVSQIPIARWIDSKKGEVDDYQAMMLGSLMQMAAALTFIWITREWQLYLLQVLSGFGCAFSYPSWMAIFTRHIDKNQEGLEWSLYYTLTDIGIALAAIFGGVIATNFSYEYVFLSISILNFLGILALMRIREQLYQ